MERKLSNKEKKLQKKLEGIENKDSAQMIDILTDENSKDLNQVFVMEVCDKIKSHH